MVVTVVADHHAAFHVDLEVEQVAAALQEVAPVGARVEADDVVGEQPVEDLVADLGRQHAPGIRLRPRDVHEVVQERVRTGLPDHRREGVELVVVDHDDRLVLAVDLLQHRLGEILGDNVVAELERLDLVAPDATKRTRKLPPCGTSFSNERPPCSSATSTSRSVIADAIQTASRCDAKPIRAVASPPVPRLTEPSSW